MTRLAMTSGVSDRDGERLMLDGITGCIPTLRHLCADAGQPGRRQFPFADQPIDHRTYEGQPRQFLERL